MGSSLSSIPKAALEHCRFALEVDKTEIMQLSQLRNKGFAILRTARLEIDPLFSGLEGLCTVNIFFFFFFTCLGEIPKSYLTRSGKNEF